MTKTRKRNAESPTKSKAASEATVRERPRASKRSTSGFKRYATANEARTGTMATRPTTYSNWRNRTAKMTAGTHPSHQNGERLSVMVVPGSRIVRIATRLAGAVRG